LITARGMANLTGIVIILV
jgi:hypothetical protein